MEALTIQSHHPPNDPADFVANRVALPGVTNIQYDAETDQMQVGLRPSNHGSLAAWVYQNRAGEIVALTRNEGRTAGWMLWKSATGSSPS